MFLNKGKEGRKERVSFFLEILRRGQNARLANVTRDLYMPYLLSFNIFQCSEIITVYIASTGLCYCTVLGKHLHPCEQYAPHKMGTRSVERRWLCYPPVKHVAGWVLSS